jgi:hypothetical protein
MLGGPDGDAGGGTVSRHGAGAGRPSRSAGLGLSTAQDRGDLVAEANPVRLATTVIAALQGGMLLARVRGELGPRQDALELAMAELHRWEAKAAPRGGHAQRSAGHQACRESLASPCRPDLLLARRPSTPRPRAVNMPSPGPDAPLPGPDASAAHRPAGHWTAVRSRRRA